MTDSVVAADSASIVPSQLKHQLYIYIYIIYLFI
jgi:hypothetical protein